MSRIPTTPRQVCPVCKNTRGWHLVRARRFSWKHCPVCKTWIFAGPDSSVAYPTEYYGGSESKFTGLAQHLREAFHRARARRVRRWLAPGVATVYDVGCGDGLFLQAASRLGLQIRGFEPEPVPRRQAEQRLRQRLDATMPKASHQSRFSAITCWQVIEHVRDPREFLRLLRGALKKNGLLAISTVNRNSWQARCFGVRWLHLDPPRHLWIGSMPTVRKMVEDAGFQVLEVFHRPLEFGPVGWVDSLWNFWGTERDRLLRCLKRGCWGPADRLLWLLSVALAPWAAVLAVAESLFGSPATFEIYARLDRKRARRQGG